MNEDQALIDVLAQLLPAAKPHLDHYATYRPDFGVRERSEWLTRQPPLQRLAELQQSIQGALESHPVFGRADSRFFGAKQLMLGPWYQAFNLLKVSHARGPTEAVAWLHKVCANTQTDLRYVAEVHGLKLSEKISLSNGVQLVPLEQLPPSPHASGLITYYRGFPIFPNARPMFTPVGAIYEVRGVQASTDFARSSRDMGPRSTELERTVRAFSLAGEASPIIGVCWLEFIDADLALAEFGQMWMSPMAETDVGHVAPLTITDDALEWVERYIRLPAHLQRTCDVATERLILARCRHYPGNKAIEGAICLEALLGDRSSQELTYRLRLRGALLLATSLNERREISAAIRDFYKLRSQTVHGVAISPEEMLKQHACAARGIAICADALRAIVELNQKYVPQDWELSGGRPTEPSD